MSESQKIVKLGELVNGALGEMKQDRPKVYRYEIFKGVRDEKGRVQKKKIVGHAYNREGLKTYTVHLKTFLNDTFYLLPNSRDNGPDFVILTREPGQTVGKKYFWNSVGECRVLGEPNNGLVQLSWDILPEELFMYLTPLNVTDKAEAVRGEEAA